MEFLSAVAGLLALLCIALAVVGIFRPQVFANRATGKAPRRRYIVGGTLAIAFVALMVSGLLDPKMKLESTAASKPAAATAPATPPQAAPAAPAAPPAKAREVADLGLTVDQYLDNFNADAAKSDTGLRAQPSEITTGPVNDAMQVIIDERRGVVLTLVKGTKQVSAAVYHGQGNGTPQSGVDVLVGAISAVQAAAPAADRAEIGNAMMRLLARAEKNKDTVSEVIGGREVWMLLSDVTGFMAGINAPEKD